MSTNFNDQDNEFDDDKLTILGIISVITNPTKEEELPNKKYVDEPIKGSILRFNQTLRNYIKMSVEKNDLF